MTLDFMSLVASEYKATSTEYFVFSEDSDVAAHLLPFLGHDRPYSGHETCDSEPCSKTQTRQDVSGLL